MIEVVINLVILGFFLSLGFFVGGYLERRHFRRLDSFERENSDFLITQIKQFPDGVSSSSTPKLVVAEAVISSDYLKTFLSSIRKFFGGELKSYRSLLERARREALARVIQQAKDQGYDAICNLRFDTADIAGATNPQKATVLVAMVASATAYQRSTTGDPSNDFNNSIA